MGEEVVEQGWRDGWMEGEGVSDWVAGLLVEVGVLSGGGWGRVVWDGGE